MRRGKKTAEATTTAGKAQPGKTQAGKKKKMSKGKKFLLGVVSLSIVFGGVAGGYQVGTNGVGDHFSTGSRTGIITEFNQAGSVFNRTWEGTLLMSKEEQELTGSPSRGFQFSVSDPKVIKAIQKENALGEEVTLTYDQYLVKPFLDAKTNFVIEKVTPVPGQQPAEGSDNASNGNNNNGGAGDNTAKNNNNNGNNNNGNNGNGGGITITFGNG